MDRVQDKQALRDKMKQIRSQVPAASRELQSRAASLLAESEWLAPLRKARGRELNVCCYLSFGDEPDTGYLLQSCKAQGDRLIVPRLVGRTMKLHLLEQHQELVPGLWGIPEPPGDAEEWGSERYGGIDAVIIPGLAFDRWGGRIGFGAGYYDRLIAQIRAQEALSVRVHESSNFPAELGAIALREQILEERVPMEPHDFRVDRIFTPDGIMEINDA